MVEQRLGDRIQQLPERLVKALKMREQGLGIASR
jgi:hypothetical protein